MIRYSGCMAAFVLITFFCGCAEPIKNPPYSVAEYQRLRASNNREYTTLTIRQINEQRLLDKNLSADKRIDSMKLLVYMFQNDPAVNQTLSAVIDDPACPNTLFSEIKKALEGKGYTVVAQKTATPAPQKNIYNPPQPPRQTDIKPPQVNQPSAAPAGTRVEVPSPSQITTAPIPAPSKSTAYAEPVATSSRNTGKALGVQHWVYRISSPNGLAEVVKHWAKEPLNGPEESNIRKAVEQVHLKVWDKVLLESINAPGFSARGSALEVLAARIPQKELKSRILKMMPDMLAIEAMQVFISKFGYVPVNGEQLLSCVTLYTRSRNMFDSAARLSESWARQYDYEFRISDLHLLCRLANDPIRQRHNADELTLRLGTVLSRRSHALMQPQDFIRMSRTLSVVDLWNLWLINEMLEKDRVRMGLGVMAQRVRKDYRKPRGGLVSYENGFAVANLYSQSQDSTSDDFDYKPSKAMEKALHDAMCVFHTRFQKNHGYSQAKPTALELLKARREGYYGLVLTMVDTDRFAAFYYNPKGSVVSLGIFSTKPDDQIGI